MSLWNPFEAQGGKVNMIIDLIETSTLNKHAASGEKGNGEKTNRRHH